MPHRPNHRGRQYRRNYAHGGPHARANEFRNRRTGQAVPAGAPYHMHPDKGPMEGAVHNPDIPGGTAGHDFYDRVNGQPQPMSMTGNPNRRLDERIRAHVGSQQQARSRTSSGGRSRTSSGGGYRRGGRVNRRKFATGGHTHGHDHYIPELGIRTTHQSVMGGQGVGGEHSWGFNPEHMTAGYDAFAGHNATIDGHSHPGRTTQQMTYRGNGGGNNDSSHTRARSIQTSAPDPRTWDRTYNMGPYYQGLPIMGPHNEWMRKGGRTNRRMEHGGSHCGPGLMYQNGGCVSYEHGGHHQVINSDSDRQRRKR